MTGDVRRFIGEYRIIKRAKKGGPGSGNFGHAGRPGEIGGSGAGGGGSDAVISKIIKDPLAAARRTVNERVRVRERKLGTEGGKQLAGGKDCRVEDLTPGEKIEAYEEFWYDARVEHGMLMDQNDEITHVFMGDKNTIAVPDNEVSQNSIFIHNHPGELITSNEDNRIQVKVGYVSPSSGDLHWAAEHNVAEIRSYDKEFECSLKRVGDKWPSKEELDDIDNDVTFEAHLARKSYFQGVLTSEDEFPAYMRGDGVAEIIGWQKATENRGDIRFTIRAIKPVDLSNVHDAKDTFFEKEEDVSAGDMARNRPSEYPSDKARMQGIDDSELIKKRERALAEWERIRREARAEKGGPGSGNFGHVGRPDEVGGSGPSGGGGGEEETTHVPQSDHDKRVARAKATHKPADKAKHDAATANENKLAKAINGVKQPDNSPFDVIRGKNAIEVKTIIEGQTGKITMHGDSLALKRETAEADGMEAHTVVFDNRHPGDIYYKVGVGNYRISAMAKTTIPELKRRFK